MTPISRSSLLMLALTSMVLLGAASARAADSYTITDLGVLPGKANSWVWQQTINNKGEVAVYSNDIPDPNAFFSDEAAIWSNGNLTPLYGLPGSTSTIASSLNNRGMANGYSRQQGGFQHAVVWDNGRLIQLPELPGDTRGYSYTLNDRNQVVGFTRHPDPSLPFQIRHATVWNRVGDTFVVTRLPGLTSGLTGDGFDQVFGINQDGKMCGESGPYAGAEHAVLWDKRGVHDLGTLGGPTSTAVAINDQGQIVGFADTATQTLPFVWKSGAMVGLGLLSGDVFGLAQGVNNRGQIVGYSQSDLNDLNTSHALLWKKGALTNLQTAIPADSRWTLLQACGINERGQISGFGIHDGQYRAFLLTPHDN